MGRTLRTVACALACPLLLTACVEGPAAPPPPASAPVAPATGQPTTPGPSAARTTTDTAAPVASDLYTRARAAGVEVLVDDHLSGSGAFVDGSGLIITAAHVVWARGTRVEVLTEDRGRLAAEVVGVDAGRDTALLQVAASNTPYVSLPLAERVPPPGTGVFLYGAPQYRHGVLLHGYIARATSTFEYLPDPGYYVENIHVNASTPPGTSGGVWMDAGGNVIGVQSGMMHDRNAPSGIAFMAPVEGVHGLVRARRSVDTPSIGTAVEEIWEHDRTILGRYPERTEGVFLQRVEATGPAAQMGLKDWDLVVAIDGQPVRLRDEFLRAVRGGAVGTSLTFSVLDPQAASPRTVKLNRVRLEDRGPRP